LKAPESPYTFGRNQELKQYRLKPQPGMLSHFQTGAGVLACEDNAASDERIRGLFDPFESGKEAGVLRVLENLYQRVLVRIVESHIDHFLISAAVSHVTQLMA
jgi:hypothetical protein